MGKKTISGFTSPPLEPLRDPENGVGKAYAASLHMKAKTVISGLVLTKQGREDIARDLRTLAYIAEHYPEAFAHVPPNI